MPVRSLEDVPDEPGFPPFCAFVGLLVDLFSLALWFRLDGLLPLDGRLVEDSSDMFEYNCQSHEMNIMYAKGSENNI